MGVLRSPRRLSQVTPAVVPPPTRQEDLSVLHAPGVCCLAGFRFSRASYLLSLLRPQIYSELELKVLKRGWVWGVGDKQWEEPQFLSCLLALGSSASVFLGTRFAPHILTFRPSSLAGDRSNPSSLVQISHFSLRQHLNSWQIIGLRTFPSEKKERIVRVDGGVCRLLPFKILERSPKTNMSRWFL